MALVVVLQNTSNLAPVSDYTYQVFIGDGTPERSTVVASGTVTGHVRVHGWQALVQKLLDTEGGK